LCHNKESFKERSKKEVAEEMFGEGAYLAIITFLETMNKKLKEVEQEELK